MDEQYITEEMLAELGIDLSGQDTIALLAHLNETLEERIGVEITDSLDDSQLQELIEIQDSNDDKKLAAFLEKHVPELQEIISDNVDILLGELAEDADFINESE